MPHTEPLRLRVLKKLTDELKKITPVNGFQADLSESVFRGRDVFDKNDPVPMVSILESILEKEQLQAPPAGTTKAGPWELLIQGWAEDDHENPTDPAYFLLADVQQRIAEIIRMPYLDPARRGCDILQMGGIITALRFSRGVVRPADEVSSKAYFWLKVELDLVENLLDPFA